MKEKKESFPLIVLELILMVLTLPFAWIFNIMKGGMKKNG